MDFQNAQKSAATRREAESKRAGSGDVAGNGGGDVIPPPDSHNLNTVGVHWLRCSFPTKALALVTTFLSSMFGKSEQDEFGLWSYTDRHVWQNKASVNYDSDPERSERVHRGRATFDCPGGALDELTAPDMTLLIDFFCKIGATCSRCDVYFDDYARIVSPKEVQPLIESSDYTGFRQAAFTRSYKGKTLAYDMAMFGGRGQQGHGKYLRFYDKYLESGGRANCCRWECEFTGQRANAVFETLAKTSGNLQAFATLCGSLIAGSISFVRRTGDKNVSRLDRYEWWEQITAILGKPLKIRIERRPETVTGKIAWLTRDVAPSLACLQNVFASDSEFFGWLWDVLDAGEDRMNNFTAAIADEFSKAVTYDRAKHRVQINTKTGIRYVKMS